MKRPFHPKPPQRVKPTYGIFANPKSGEFSQKKVDELIKEIAASGANWHLIQSDNEKEAVFQLRKLIGRHPYGVIACGGDGTVNLIARNLIRRTCSMGIFPLGKENNIFRSLYGDPDTKTALRHILSHSSRKIDHGLVAGHFFLCSVGIGLIPELHELLDRKGAPYFAIGWSRLASQAASSVPAAPLTVTMDEFQFNITPQLLGIHLLSHTCGLSMTPTALDDDGKAEVIFDVGGGKAIMSSFIRQVYKKKYLFSDDIRMFRGGKINISPVNGRKLYLDGDIIELTATAIEVEILQSKIRIFQDRD